MSRRKSAAAYGKQHARPCFWCGRPFVTPGSAMARVVATLAELDGWWTIPAVAERAGVNKDTARRYVYRLNGELERRPKGRGFEYRWHQTT